MDVCVIASIPLMHREALTYVSDLTGQAIYGLLAAGLPMKLWQRARV